MSQRRVRLSAGHFAHDVGPCGHPGNGARRAAPVARVCAVALIAAAMGGCSLSFPAGHLSDDSLATGSIDRAAAMLSPALDREDLRRARAALAVTLDPQGNGERAAWHNPQTGAHGVFTAEGPPFPKEDRVCRKFVGEIAAGGTHDREVSGLACRDGAGDWALLEALAAHRS